MAAVGQKARRDPRTFIATKDEMQRLGRGRMVPALSPRASGASPG